MLGGSTTKSNKILVDKSIHETAVTAAVLSQTFRFYWNILITVVVRTFQVPSMKTTTTHVSCLGWKSSYFGSIRAFSQLTGTLVWQLVRCNESDQIFYLLLYRCSQLKGAAAAKSPPTKHSRLLRLGSEIPNNRGCSMVGWWLLLLVCKAQFPITFRQCLNHDSLILHT